MTVSQQDRIQPYAANPAYWQYKGQPALLLGGSIEDNLFQISQLEAHLDLLKSVGGNYVRCTMSSRDEGDVWPFERDGQSGLYDLNKPGIAYWERFAHFLKLTAEREIIVQIEMWDRFDFARNPWQDNPYNPKNNINYEADEVGLKLKINTHPGRRENDFFHSVPQLQNNTRLLQFQQAQVDQLLAHSLQYGHVLYCMDNETNDLPEWGWYWAQYIREKAHAAGTEVEMTEMWDAHDLLAGEHRHTFDHPELFSFVDISQNNHRPAQPHWENAQAVRKRFQVARQVKPMNSVKIYGSNRGRYGSTRDAQERFWRNIFGGLAAARFHRPPSGLGLDDIAQAHIRSMRMLTEAMNIFQCGPHRDLLSNNSWNEAYCIAKPGTEYAVFFCDGGDIQLDVEAVKRGQSLTIRWLDIRRSQWRDPQSIASGKHTIRLATPMEEGYWAALVQVAG